MSMCAIMIHEKPHLFANMLGNTESLLVVRYLGEAPLIVVNSKHTAVPVVTPVPADLALSLDAVHYTSASDGTPFIYVAAAAPGVGGQRDLQIISGRLMTERTRMLSDYRNQILLFASTSAFLAALLAFGLARRGMYPLRRLAAQTTSIGMGTLSTRIDRRDAPRELDGLIGAFNSMLNRLERGFTQLKQVSADMAHAQNDTISDPDGYRILKPAGLVARTTGGGYAKPELTHTVINLDFGHRWGISLADGEEHQRLVNTSILSGCFDRPGRTNRLAEGEIHGYARTPRHRRTRRDARNGYRRTRQQRSLVSLADGLRALRLGTQPPLCPGQLPRLLRTRRQRGHRAGFPR
jgi:HAMP domain-containing protein